MNQVSLIGRLVYTPELKKTNSGKSYLVNVLAVESNNRTKDNQRKTNFIRIVAFNKRAETIANYLQKGAKIGLVGSLEVSNRENNKNLAYYSVKISEITFCESKKPAKQEVADDSDFFAVPTPQNNHLYQDSFNRRYEQTF